MFRNDDLVKRDCDFEHNEQNDRELQTQRASGVDDVSQRISCFRDDCQLSL